MSNRLLMNIINAIEWLSNEAETKEFHKDVIRFLKQAITFLQPAVEELRGKDISETEKIKDEYSLLVILNELIDHFDYINSKNGMLMFEEVKMSRFQLDLARQTMRLGSAKIPEIRENLEKILKSVEISLNEEPDNINLGNALVRMKGTINDLENV